MNGPGVNQSAGFVVRIGVMKTNALAAIAQITSLIQMIPTRVATVIADTLVFSDGDDKKLLTG